MSLLKPSRLWHQVCATLFIALFLSGCLNVLREDHPLYKYLVSANQVTAVPIEYLRQTVTDPTYASLLKYSVGAFKVVYKTTNYDGKSIEASGLLLIPDLPANTKVPMISQQHGTIFSDAEAPSNFGPTSEAAQYGTIFSSNGYIIACPDYIGFGASNKLIHTYEHNASLAQASLDMLRAAKEFLQVNAPGKWDERLYLAGYSEGGYATMALYKKIQEDPIAASEFLKNLRAVSTGAGAYDKTKFTKAVIGAPILPTTVEWNRAFLWVLLTYNDIYPTLHRSLDKYFKLAYLADIQANRQLASISGPFADALTDEFKTGILNGTDMAFLNALADNDIYDWKPLIPLLLTHGDHDSQVYLLNTLSAIDAMITKNGSMAVLPNVKESAKTGKDQTHANTISDWITDTYGFFQKFQ